MKKQYEVAYTIAGLSYGFAGMFTSVASVLNRAWLGFCVMFWAMFLCVVICYYADKIKELVA